MLKKGCYIANNYDTEPNPLHRYEALIQVKETEKAFILELEELYTRYGATQLEDMFRNSDKVTIRKGGSNHALHVWDEHSFTLYPYRVGVPFYFKRDTPS